MLRLAIAQFRPRKAEYDENLRRVGDVFHDIAGQPAVPDLLVFPEAALTGYFLEGGVQEVAVPAERLFADLAEAHRASGAPPIEVIIGFYEVWQARLHNSVLAAALGGTDAGIRHVHRKVFLPTYGVFDEERFVEPGLTVEAFDLRCGRTAALVCEDAWHSLLPTIAALDGAECLVVVSASPARGIQPDIEGDGRPASVRRWERTIQSIASEHGLYVVMAQLAGFEGGKALQGGSCVVGPRGEVLARAPLFEEALLQVEVDLEEIARARAEAPLLSDLEVRLPHLVDSLAERRGRGAGGPVPKPAPPRSRPAVVRPPQQALEATDPLAIDPSLTRRWLVEFLRDEVRRRRGFQRVVVGLSGGVDSALVAFLAAEAFGPEHVTAIRMPYRASSSESLTHAQLVIDQTGIGSETVEISMGVDGLAGALPEPPTPARLGNVMARMRMITLFDRSAALEALPLGTGNKSERLFGYFTWHADDSPPVNPIGDLFKTQVWDLARHVGVPEVIVEKPATADLVSGQTDEADFGISYHRADPILHWLLLGYRPEEVQALGFTAEEVQLVRHRLESTHWKRRLPTVAMLSQTAIGEYYLRPVDY
jgi:NAD+ synthase (glutamine-hydrolysing)